MISAVNAESTKQEREETNHNKTNINIAKFDVRMINELNDKKFWLLRVDNRDVEGERQIWLFVNNRIDLNWFIMMIGLMNDKECDDNEECDDNKECDVWNLRESELNSIESDGTIK